MILYFTDLFYLIGNKKNGSICIYYFDKYRPIKQSKIVNAQKIIELLNKSIISKNMLRKEVTLYLDTYLSNYDKQAYEYVFSKLLFSKIIIKSEEEILKAIKKHCIVKITNNSISCYYIKYNKVFLKKAINYLNNCFDIKKDVISFLNEYKKVTNLGSKKVLILDYSTDGISKIVKDTLPNYLEYESNESILKIILDKKTYI